MPLKHEDSQQEVRRSFPGTCKNCIQCPQMTNEIRNALIRSQYLSRGADWGLMVVCVGELMQESEIGLFFDEKSGTAFCLQINFPNIFADNTHRNHLNAPDKADATHGASPAGNGMSEKEG